MSHPAITPYLPDQLFAACHILISICFHSSGLISCVFFKTVSPLFLKHYHTFMINAGDCWRPKATLLQTLHR